MKFLIENASFLKINMFLYLDVKVFVHVIEILYSGVFVFNLYSFLV